MSETDWLALLPQYATVVALFFTGYVWWASNRDRKIEALKKLNGELIYLCIKKANFDALPSEQRLGINELQSVFGRVVDEITGAIRDGGSNVSYALANETISFTSNLNSFSHRWFRGSDALDKLNQEWGELFKELQTFLKHLYAEIEGHKFRYIPRNLYHDLRGGKIANLHYVEPKTDSD
jgi:hypothetical protein